MPAKLSTFLAICCLFLRDIYAKDPSAVWPSSFFVSFNETMNNGRGNVTGNGRWYYDFANARARQERDDGSLDRFCGSANQVKSPCVHLNPIGDSNRYLVWPELSPISCCVCGSDSAGFGVLRPDWVSASNGTYLGKEFLDSPNYNGQADAWHVIGLQSNFYYQDPVTSVPLAIAQGTDDYMFFDEKTFTKGPQDDSLFLKPFACNNAPKCSGLCSFESEKDNRNRSPNLSSWKVVSIADYGAIGDNKTDNTEAIRAALRDVEGGGEVIIPAGGLYKSGVFNLTSNVLLTVLGEVWGIENATEFPMVPGLPSYASPDAMPGNRHHPFVWSVGASNVTIAGTGVLNGGGPYWWWEQGQSERWSINRPHLVEFNNCTDVVITGVTLRNSAFWTLRPVYSRNVHFHDMAIDAPWCNEGGMNTDGIDVDSSQNVMIERNHISCGDDHVTVISGAGAAGRAFAMPSKNVTVRDNILGTGMGLSVGSSVSGGVEDVLFQNNVMEERPTDWGLGAHLKTRITYGGYVRNVAWIDNVFNLVTTTSIQIETDYQSSGYCTAENCTEIRDIVFRNFTVHNNAGPGRLNCYPNRPCINITLENVWINTTGKWGCSNVSSGTFINVYPPGLQEACGL